MKYKSSVLQTIIPFHCSSSGGRLCQVKKAVCCINVGPQGTTGNHIITIHSYIDPPSLPATLPPTCHINITSVTTDGLQDQFPFPPGLGQPGLGQPRGGGGEGGGGGVEAVQLGQAQGGSGHISVRDRQSGGRGGRQETRLVTTIIVEVGRG